ncbi:MAG: hypothetical protein K0R56_1756 [Sphingomonas sp.]|jgi:hypothetical protein|nr:hypothetical protein [Sphingomonas sp.]
MRIFDGDSDWLVRSHYWLVLAFVLGGTGTLLML